jgi:hypothetical protein
LKDERNLLQAKVSQAQERAKESIERESYQHNRSTIEDKLIIQQLKDERNELRSQLSQARHQTQESVERETYQRNRSTLEDKLIIQQLKDERNELRSKLSEAESYQRNRSTIEDELIIQQLKDERNELRSKLVEAQARKQGDASQHSRSTMEDKLVIQQLKDERNQLQSKLAQAQERQGDEKSEFTLVESRQKRNLTIQQRKDERNKLRAKLQQLQRPENIRNQPQKEDSNDSAAPVNGQALSTPSGSMKTIHPTIVTTPLPKAKPSPAPSQTSKSTSTPKLNELRAHKKSIESQLKTMVSPTNVHSMMGSLQDELAANKQVIAEQTLLLKQSAAKQRSHERIIAEKNIQLKLLTKKKRNHENLASRKYQRRFNHWKQRLQHDLEVKYESLLEQYTRQLDYFDLEYDVKTYVSQDALPYIGGGILVLAKLVIIFMLWFSKE